MVVFVSRCDIWIVAQECDTWIVLELIDDEESIQICDEIKGRWWRKRSMSTVLTALLMFTLAADSHPFESRCRKQNSGAVTRTREAPARRFQAIARVYVSVVQN